MPERDADATRARLLAAAANEFAAYGIAGARVDRIASAAQANKAQIYHYFGSKDDLFAAVFAAYAVRASTEEYFDARDLPETAGRIFDQFAAHPELGRLITWYRLERAGAEESIAVIAEANEAKYAAIRAAQADGVVSDRLPAEVLLGLILNLATAWISPPPEFRALADNYDTAQQRGFVVTAVERLTAP